MSKAKNKRKQVNLVCLRYIPRGENTEVKIYIDAKRIPSGKHHEPPSSRRGQTIINLDRIVHWAWHVLFGNDRMKEVIGKIIHTWPDEQGQIKEEEYLLGRIKEDAMGTKYDERYLAWYIIFDDTRDAEKAIKIINKIFVKRT